LNGIPPFTNVTRRFSFKNPTFHTAPCARSFPSALSVSAANTDAGGEQHRASPPHRPREDGLDHPPDTSISNLADALGLLKGGGFPDLAWRAAPPPQAARGRGRPTLQTLQDPILLTPWVLNLPAERPQPIYFTSELRRWYRVCGGAQHDVSTGGPAVRRARVLVHQLVHGARGALRVRAGEVLPRPGFPHRRLKILQGQGRGGLGYRFTVQAYLVNSKIVLLC
jgi:hypothetical protein